MMTGWAPDDDGYVSAYAQDLLITYTELHATQEKLYVETFFSIIFFFLHVSLFQNSKPRSRGFSQFAMSSVHI